MTHKLSTRVAAALTIGALAFGVAACGSDDDEPSGGGGGGGEATAEATDAKVGVILPDAASSARWETADRKFLGEAFKAAGVESDIQNANGDKAKFATIADQMLNAGATVLLIVNLDSPSAAAVIKKATQQGVPVIDYDRLTLGGGASYYVSFDNVAVGTAIGEGLVKCMGDNGKSSGPVALLNGSPTDNNATLFKQGYEKAITDGGYTVAADQSVPDWDNTKAGTIFEQMFTKANGDFVGVAAANDGLGGAVASVLGREGAAKDIPTTGQDATDEGLQRVLLGTQCMTVYKAIKKEADAAAALAIALAKGDTAGADSQATGQVEDTETKQQVKTRAAGAAGDLPGERQGRDRGRVHDRGQGLHERRAQEGLRRERHQRMTKTTEGQQRELLSLRGINKSFGAVHVLRDVDLDVRPGEVTALVGDNGAGKSTLIKCVAGIHPFDSGEVVFDGKPVNIHGPKDANALGIEIVYQDLALCDNLDVVHNMFLGRELHSGVTLDETSMEKRAGETLKSLSVRTLRSLRQNVSSLSGGQRQTVAIARAVLWNSKLVILDEPTAALGVAQTEQVLNLVRRLAENGLGVVLITHNMNDVFQVADSIACLFLGQMAAQVRSKDVNNTQVIELITAGRSGDLGLRPQEAAQVGAV